MLNLIAKDFKLLFTNKGSKLSRFLSVILTLFICGFFVYVETTLFSSILTRVKVYGNAAKSFFTIFLFVIAMLLTILCLFSANKIFFNEIDNIQLGPYPISNGKKVASKTIFLFAIMYFFNFIFNLPVLIAYGIIYDKVIFYFYASLYYPVFIFLFEAGISLLFLIPFKSLMDYLKKHTFIQLIFVILVGLILSIAYGLTLNVFLNVMNSKNIDLFFTKRSLDSLSLTAKYLFPVNLLVEAFIESNIINIFSFVCICGGIFLLGVSIVSEFYNRFTYIGINNLKQNIVKKEKAKVSSISLSLIKKELIILFRNSNFIITFSGLLFVEPFLIYFVIKGINTIFSSGTLAYYALAVPDLVTVLDLLIVLLMVATIAQSGTNYISNENKSIKIMKTIPISEHKQLFIKMVIPYLSVILFLFLSCLVLTISGQISFLNALFYVIISSLFVLLISLISLYEELKIKRNKERSTFLSSLVSYLYPASIFLIMLLLSYFRTNIYLSYLIGIGIILILGVPILLVLKTKVSKWFLDMEVIN